MKSISTAVKIWIKAVFLVSVCVGFIAIMGGNIFGFFLAVVSFFFNFFASLPLLPAVFALIEISKGLSQYNIRARIAWLTFYLVALFYFFYVLVAKVGYLNELEPFFDHLSIFTPCILLIAVLTTRKSLNKLYQDQKIVTA